MLPFIVANLWAIMHALAGAPYARMVDGMEQTAAAIISVAGQHLTMLMAAQTDIMGQLVITRRVVRPKSR